MSTGSIELISGSFSTYMITVAIIDALEIFRQVENPGDLIK